MSRDDPHLPTDLNRVIDSVWPALQRAQKVAWLRVMSAALIYSVVVIAARHQFDDLGAKVVTVGGLIALLGVLILSQSHVARAGTPLVPQILTLAGFSKSEGGAGLDHYARRGLLPLGGAIHPGDHLACDLGPHRLERIAVSVAKVTQGSDGGTNRKVYFAGDLFRITALPRQSVDQLVVRADRSRGSKEITRRFATHYKLPWRSKNRTQLDGLGTVMQSPDGRCDPLMTTLKAAATHVPPHRDFFSALREDDTIVIALLGTAPTLSVGGLVMSRYSVERKIDRILTDLTATLAMAQAIIAAETAGRT